MLSCVYIMSILLIPVKLSPNLSPMSLCIEKTLLRRAERLAKAQSLYRSELFRRGLRAVLALAGAA